MQPFTVSTLLTGNCLSAVVGRLAVLVVLWSQAVNRDLLTGPLSDIIFFTCSVLEPPHCLNLPQWGSSRWPGDQSQAGLALKEEEVHLARRKLFPVKIYPRNIFSSFPTVVQWWLNTFFSFFYWEVCVKTLLLFNYRRPAGKSHGITWELESGAWWHWTWREFGKGRSSLYRYGAALSLTGPRFTLITTQLMSTN